jgi:glycosyltransferase involved in cell wall biosynthesis
VSRPLVSVVTTSYNQAAFLEETIESVLSQDYEPLEYLVVDDGSTDGSIDVIRRYEDRLTWWAAQENAGQAAALNRGFARATGAVLSFLSSDDTLLPGTVSRVVHAFEAEPDLLMVYGDVLITDERSNVVEHQTSGEWRLPAMARTVYTVHQPASFFTRRAWELAGPFDERSWGLFDVEFGLRLAAVGEARHLHEPLATFRLHAESKQLSRHARMAEECLRFAHDFFESPDLPEPLRPYARAARATLHRRAALNYLAAGEHARARRAFLRSLVLTPRGLTRKQGKRLARTLVPGRLR